jgi:hypothetical protein
VASSIRFVLSERGGTPLPMLPIKIDDDTNLVIGSAVGAAVRLPPGQVQPQHITLRRHASKWTYIAHGDTELVGATQSGLLHNGDVGILALPCEFAIGPWQVTMSPGEITDPDIDAPMRTASLARELARSLMSGISAPTLAIVNADGNEADKRELPPPEIRITVGRGDDADWRIDDEDLSRLHVAIVRGWDGVHVVDLESKNGTQLNGQHLTAHGTGALLRHGDVITLGNHRFRFSDPVEALERSQHPLTPTTYAPTLPASPAVGRLSQRDTTTFYLALAICIAATLAAAWLLLAGLRATPLVR